MGVVCRLTTLSNFGTAVFGLDNTGVGGTSYSTINGVTGPISSASNVAITMVSGSTILAEPSSLSNDGTSFSVAYG